MVSKIKEEKGFIPKERGSLPRVLLLDFAKKEAYETLQKAKFQVFEGKSGFVDGLQEFPQDSSEIDIIFWDVSDCKFAKYEEGTWGKGERVLISDKESMKNTGYNILHISHKTLYDYFKQIRKRGGFIGIFLSDKKIIDDTRELSYILGLSDYSEAEEFGFYLERRYTRRVELKKPKNDDLFFNFFNRFFQDNGNIKFIIDWRSSSIDRESPSWVYTDDGTTSLKYREIVNFYFSDEDNNHYAVVAYDKILISPKIDNISDALLFLLQDILPHICKENIYPDLHTYKWLNDEFFKSSEIRKKKRKLGEIKEEYEKAVSKNIKNIENAERSFLHLQQMLYSDDSERFKKGEKLKDIVIKVLSKDFKFDDVVDVDEIRKERNLALKEDLRIGKNVLIELKGTERGAKASWVDDLQKHAYQYCKMENVDPKDLKLILIFNHERRKDPRERNKPFKGDPETIKTCEGNNISLIPVFELFKLAMDVKENKISNEESKKKILESKGLFTYKK